MSEIRVLETSDRLWWVEPEIGPFGHGVVLHGYGQTHLEALPPAILLGQEGYSLVLTDLPGHGNHPDPLTADGALALAHQLLDEVAPDGPLLALGFSLGARLALSLPVDVAIAISPPGPAEFGGDRRELLRELRPRMVRESSTLAGLTETLTVLNQQPIRAKRHLVVVGQRDLPSVLAFADAQGPGVVRIRGADHHGTWWHPDTWRIVTRWIGDAITPPVRG